MHFEKEMRREYESNENSFKQLIVKIVSQCKSTPRCPKTLAFEAILLFTKVILEIPFYWFRCFVFRIVSGLQIYRQSFVAAESYNQGD